MFLMRNPWGIEKYYNQSWNYNDSRWTPDMVNQVPFGIDPRTSANKTGAFVIAAEMFDPKKGCFGNFAITHYRPDEGYTKTWFDVENADE